MAHVVIEEAPSAVNATATAENGTLVTLSARDGERLADAVARLAAYFEEKSESPSLGEIAHTLRTGRESLAARLAMVVADERELVEKLVVYLGTRGPEAGYHLGVLERPLPVLAKQPKGATCGPLNGLDRGQLESLAERWSKGAPIDWTRCSEGYRRCAGLPTYPFARKRHWISETGS